MDPLRDRFGDRIFKDTDNIAPGQDFLKVINRELESCSVLLAVIGRDWLSAKDKANRRRLDNPNDYLRLEIGTALKKDVLVIPVLVGAEMPSPDDLPEDLKPLSFRQSVELSNTRFQDDVQRLIRVIDPVMGVVPAPAPPPPVAASPVDQLTTTITFSLDRAVRVPNTNTAFYPVDDLTDFHGVSYAGTISASVNRMLRLGMTVSFNHLDAASSVNRFAFDENLVRTNITVHRTSIASTDNDTGITIGALVTPSDAVSFGVSYAKQPRFTVSETFQFNSGFNNDPSLSTNGQFQTFDDFPKPVSINVPDRVGAGVAVRPHSRLIIVADVVHIGYSSLAENVTLVFDVPGATAQNYEINDTTEVHAGAEFALMRSVFVRGGLYTNPDHSVRFNPGTDEETNAGETAINNLARRDTQVKGTFGGGFAIGRYLQADLAYVWKKELVASAAFRF